MEDSAETSRAFGLHDPYSSQPDRIERTPGEGDTACPIEEEYEGPQRMQEAPYNMGGKKASLGDSDSSAFSFSF